VESSALPTQTDAQILAEAQAAANKLRKTFEMHSNGNTNGKVAEPTPAPAEPTPPFRAKNARPLGDDAVAVAVTESQDKIADQIAAQTAKMADFLKQIAGAPNAHTVIRSDATPSSKSAHAIASDITEEREYGRVKGELLKNGDMSFSLPFDVVRSSVGFITGEQREAFREVGRGPNQHIELTGDSNRQIRAGFEYAKQRWNNEAIVIKVGDRDRERVVHHAVAAGMNIDTSRDPKLAEAVAAEQKLQSLDNSFKVEVPIIERAVKQDEKKAAGVGMSV
jgi:hypothetical protein